MILKWRIALSGAGRYNEEHEFHGVECLSILNSLIRFEQRFAIHAADTEDRRGWRTESLLGGG